MTLNRRVASRFVRWDDVGSRCVCTRPVSGCRRLEPREVLTLGKSDEPGLGWAYLLSVVAFLMLAVGIWAATQSHAWTWLWPLNVLGGLLGYLPMVFWISLRDRLPRQPLFIWPARVLTFFLTIAIPFVVWAPVPPPPS